MPIAIKKIFFSIFVNKLNFWQCKSVLKQSEEDLIKSSKYITHRILCVSFSKKGYLQIRFFNIDWLHTTKSVPQINLSQPTIFFTQNFPVAGLQGLANTPSSIFLKRSRDGWELNPVLLLSWQDYQFSHGCKNQNVNIASYLKTMLPYW